jgi:hypothetical protein
MKRRHLLLALGASAMGWSRRAHAAERLIGLLVGLPQTNGSVVDRLNVFRDTLSRLGWVEHKNIRLEYRFAARGAAVTLAGGLRSLPRRAIRRKASQ